MPKNLHDIEEKMLITVVVPGILTLLVLLSVSSIFFMR